MHYYSYSVKDDLIYESLNEITGTPAEYQQCNKCDGLEIYYRTVYGAITNIICHAANQPAANNAVETFLLNYKTII